MNACSKTIAAGSLLALAAALQCGCAATPKTSNSAPVVQAAQQPRPQIITGKVVETMNSGGYTYIGLEKDGKTTWVAMPPTKVEVGQEVKVWSGTEMGTFTSKTLKRTFDNIIFSPGIATDNAAPKTEGITNNGSQPAMPEGHPPIGQQAPPAQVHAPAMDKGETNGSTISGKVVETMNSGGYTYVNLEKDGKKTWVAVPAMKVSVGQELELMNGMEMKDFPSKSLNRTFDSIIFSGGPAR